MVANLVMERVFSHVDLALGFAGLAVPVLVAWWSMVESASRQINAPSVLHVSAV